MKKSKYTGIYFNESNETWFVNTKAKTLDGVYFGISKRGFKNEKEAFKYKESEKIRIESLYADSVRGGKTQFENVCEAYLKQEEIKLARSTYIGKKKVFDNYIKPYFKDKIIDKITVSEVEAFWSNVATKDFSTYYKNRIVGEFTNLLDYLVLHNRLKFERANQFKQILIKFKGGATSSASGCKNILTPEQFKELLESFGEKKYMLAFKTLFSLGAREGELRAIQVKNIDFINRKITLDAHIDNRLQYGTWVRVEGLKTMKSRVEPIPQSLASELYEWCIDNDLKSDDYVFFSRNDKGAPISQTALRRKLDKHLEMCGLPHTRLHDIRHSFIVSMLSDGNVNVKTISTMVGHKSTSVTQDIYNHVTSEQKDLLETKLDNLF